MRIGVISDTHGHTSTIKRAIDIVGQVDMWFHAGDHSRDSQVLAKLSGLPVVAVAGNCDGSSDAKVDEFIDIDNKRIWLTHGHRYQRGELTETLVWWARQYGVDAVVYGHSHVPTMLRLEDVLVFNPGSAALPRGGSHASCGVLLVTQNIIEAFHVKI
ncbi:MAG: phosphodiesterase, family [Firmicutes bacterium]|nr:phosphodiesterase, family [Bacillota bacterium]